MGVIVLLGVATVALLVALVTRGWFTDSAHMGGVTTSYGIGLWGNAYQESCGDAVEKKYGSQCKAVSRTIEWDHLRGAKNKAWLLFGRLTLIIGFLAVFALIGLIVLLYKRHELTARLWLVPLVAVGGAMFCAGMYLALQPPKPGHLGYSVFLFFPATVAAVLGSLMAKDALSAPEERPLPGIGVS